MKFVKPKVKKEEESKKTSGVDSDTSAKTIEETGTVPEEKSNEKMEDREFIEANVTENGKQKDSETHDSSEL